MRIFVFIFSIYFLVLPGMPCAEAEVCTDDVQNTVSQSHNHSEAEKDDCGAFCSCSCCGHIVTVSIQFPKIIIDKPLVKTKALSMYGNVLLPSNHFGNIWQPPKIC